MKPGRAVVIGGSIGGLAAANFLHQGGWAVDVLERSKLPLDGRGAGIVTHSELWESLHAIGLGTGIEEGLGVSIHERIVLDSAGTVMDRYEYPQLVTAWAKVYRLLKNRLPTDRYAFGTQVLCGPDGFRRADDDTLIEADLFIAADGIRSSCRQRLLPQARPQYAGYVAWRGLVDEAELSDGTRADIFERFAFCLPPGEQMLGYPVAGPNDDVRPGKRRFNFVWYRPAHADGELSDLLTDSTGKCWSDGIPPPLIRPEVLAAARACASERLAPQLAEVVLRSKGLFFQPIFDLVSDRLAFGSVCLLGDAAFVARPHCGMGVTKAISDARVLSEALRSSKDVGAALQAYEQARLPVGQQLVTHARALGAYMQAQIASLQERAMAERYRTPAAVLKQTAVPPSQHDATLV